MDAVDHQRRLAELEIEEERLVFPRFDFPDAWRIGSALLAAAPAPIAIRIVVADHVLLAAALDGTSVNNAAWLDLKLNAVKHFGRSTLWLHHSLRAKGRTLEDIPTARLASMIDHGGGFPIRIGRQVVGAIGVSGLKHEQDHQLIIDALTTSAPRQEDRDR